MASKWIKVKDFNRFKNRLPDTMSKLWLEMNEEEGIPCIEISKLEGIVERLRKSKLVTKVCKNSGKVSFYNLALSDLLTEVRK